MFNTQTNAKQPTEERATARSLVRRNAQRVAAVAFIVIAGPTALSSLAAASPGPALNPTPQPGASDVADLPYSDAPAMTIPKPGDFEIDEFPVPTWTLPPYEIPTEPVTPELDPTLAPPEMTVPEPTVPETTVPETTVPETTVPEYPEETTTVPGYPEVEGETVERADGNQLAYTGNDSKLPLVGAGLVAAGGLVAGLSILARRTRLSQF